MYQFFIGCDVSKSWIDVAYGETSEVVYLGQFENSPCGFSQMVKQLKSQTDYDLNSWFFCFENTGSYSKLFTEWLIYHELACIEENAFSIKNSLGLRRGKNDKADARDICKYAYEKRDSLKPTKLSKAAIIKLKKLLSRRNLLIKQKVALMTSVKEQQDILGNDLREMFQAQNDRLLENYCNYIKEIELAIRELIKSDAEIKQSDDLVQSVIGLGPVISAYLIAFTDNFTQITQGRKFASYCGIAPFVHNQSGTKQGVSRVSHMANKKIKSLLSNGVNAAIMYDKEIGQYYGRKIAEGKAKGIVLNAIKNKLIHRAFAVIKRQTPYVRRVTYI